MCEIWYPGLMKIEYLLFWIAWWLVHKRWWYVAMDIWNALVIIQIDLKNRYNLSLLEVNLRQVEIDHIISYSSFKMDQHDEKPDSTGNSNKFLVIVLRSNFPDSNNRLRCSVWFYKSEISLPSISSYILSQRSLCQVNILLCLLVSVYKLFWVNYQDTVAYILHHDSLRRLDSVRCQWQSVEYCCNSSQYLHRHQSISLFCVWWKTFEF